MGKRAVMLFAVWVLVLGLCACTASQPETPGEAAFQLPTWQEQYDLGIRYLSEGNYEEAILAFTAAIEIDPKQAPAYVGRGDAYVLSGETEDNLLAAQADYEKAIELDESGAEAYLGLAGVYIRQGDYEKALEILRKGYESTSNSELLARFEALESNLSELEKIESSENQTEIPMLIEQLVLSNISYTYKDGYDERNPGSVGTMWINVTVEGPANVCDVRIWAVRKEPFLQEQIHDEAATAERIWKQAEIAVMEEELPFSSRQGHPVSPEIRTTTMYVLLIGLDGSGNAVAYGIIEEEIP